ncbi:MAG TPA: polysaccharide biosynthesis/export family protein, partial [Flavisolibacter sp.]
ISDTTIKDSMFRQTVIQKGDLLSIRVYSLASGINPEADAPYNLPDQGGSGNTNTAGILVDQNGNIEYPQVGVLKAEGLTREELAASIREKLESQLNRPTVVVRFINYKITVLGEVGSPSTFTVPTERITILEALGLAGDITEFGRKDNVKVVRDNNGEIVVGTIDLTSKDMFTSPYFKLKQNDVVMVDQTGKRIQQRERQEVAQQIGIATSIITAIALILNFIK